jgi:hypothetical protein
MLALTNQTILVQIPEDRNPDTHRTRISNSPHNLCPFQHIDITGDAYCTECLENHNGNTYGTLRGSEKDNPIKVHCKLTRCIIVKLDPGRASGAADPVGRV